MKKDTLKFPNVFMKNWIIDLVSKYLAYDEYSIADIATFPWIARHEWHDIGLKNYKNLSRWYNDISARDAVVKGYDLLNRGEKIPKI